MLSMSSSTVMMASSACKVKTEEKEGAEAHSP